MFPLPSRLRAGVRPAKQGPQAAALLPAAPWARRSGAHVKRARGQRAGEAQGAQGQASRRAAGSPRCGRGGRADARALGGRRRCTRTRQRRARRRPTSPHRSCWWTALTRSRCGGGGLGSVWLGWFLHVARSRRMCECTVAALGRLHAGGPARVTASERGRVAGEARARPHGRALSAVRLIGPCRCPVSCLRSQAARCCGACRRRARAAGVAAAGGRGAGDAAARAPAAEARRRRAASAGRRHRGGARRRGARAAGFGKVVLQPCVDLTPVARLSDVSES